MGAVLTPCTLSPLKAVVKGGYVRKKVKGKRRMHHRLAYAEAHGLDEATMGGVVMHLCDNPPCINPDHLVMGTHKANTEDMLTKGRCGRTVLKPEDVQYIRTHWVKGLTKSLADKFGVSTNHIYKVLRQEQHTWIQLS